MFMKSRDFMREFVGDHTMAVVIPTVDMRNARGEKEKMRLERRFEEGKLERLEQLGTREMGFSRGDLPPTVRLRLPVDLDRRSYRKFTIPTSVDSVTRTSFVTRHEMFRLNSFSLGVNPTIADLPRWSSSVSSRGCPYHILS